VLGTDKSGDRRMILFYDGRSLAMYLELSTEEDDALSYDSSRSITDRRPKHDAAGSAEYSQQVPPLEKRINALVDSSRKIICENKP
jgi:hypothetical protein